MPPANHCRAKLGALNALTKWWRVNFIFKMQTLYLFEGGLETLKRSGLDFWKIILADFTMRCRFYFLIFQPEWDDDWRQFSIILFSSTVFYGCIYFCWSCTSTRNFARICRRTRVSIPKRTVETHQKTIFDNNVDRKNVPQIK